MTTKTSKKLISGVLSMAVVSSMLALPSMTSAQTSPEAQMEKIIQNSQKLEAIREAKDTQDDRIELAKKAKATQVKKGTKSSIQGIAPSGDVSTKNVTGTVAATSTNVTVSGSIDGQTIHTYAITLTEAGTLNIKKSASQSVFWMLYSADGNEGWSEGETIPTLQPGEYYLDVLSGDATENYSIALSGVNMNVDTTLPTLNLTSPSKLSSVYPVGTKQITLAGSYTGDLGLLFSEQYPDGTELPSTFSKAMSVTPGYNGFNVLTAENSGNIVSKMGDAIVKDIKRLEGPDRYSTSVAISKENFEGTDTVVIARGDNFADALPGGPLASAVGGPLLLVQPTKMPTVVKSEIARLGAKKAIILGGTGAVSEDVAKELRAMGVSVERFDGANRFDVAVKAAERVLAIAKEYDPNFTGGAFIASGLNFPDALSASSPAGMFAAPILTVTTDKVPASVADFIKKHPEITDYVAVGGSAVVSDSVLQTVASYGREVGRISGANRFIVSANIADAFFGTEPNVLVVANGLNFPDALSGGPLASNAGAPMLLTLDTKLDKSIDAYINTTKPQVIYVLGGSGVVSQDVYNALAAKLK